MNLLFIGYMHGYGGAEKMLIKLANQMSIRGHNITLISLVSNNIVYDISSNINYIYIKDEGCSKLNILLHRFIRLKHHIKQTNPDLIINFWLQPTYLCALMGRNISKKTIYSERGDPMDKEYDGILKWIRKFTFYKIKGIVFQSSGARNCFGEYVKKKSCIIHNPVFVEQKYLNVKSKREKRIVTVGRLHEQKNQVLLIKAFSMLPSNLNDFILEIYGDGNLKNFLSDYIKEKGLENRVFLKGTYSNIHEKIVDASLFVLCSNYEGLPNALIEAMTLGIPCISTDCKPGGAREIINDGVNGYIVERNNVYELTNKIVYLLNHQDLANKFSKEAKRISVDFNPKIIFDKWDSYFKRT